MKTSPTRKTDSKMKKTIKVRYPNEMKKTKKEKAMPEKKTPKHKA